MIIAGYGRFKTMTKPKWETALGPAIEARREQMALERSSRVEHITLIIEQAQRCHATPRNIALAVIAAMREPTVQMKASMVERVAREIAGAETAIDDVEHDWMEFESHARAAIKAMREPTEEMLNPKWNRNGAIFMWQAMIDAALSEGK